MVRDEILVVGVLEELAGGVNGGVMESAFAGAGRPSSSSEAAWGCLVGSSEGRLEGRLDDCDAIL